MGGKVAMAYALENHEKVEKLVIVDISPRKYPERLVHTRVITEMIRTNLDAYSSRAEVENDLAKRVHDPRIRMFILKNLYYKMPGKLAWRLNLDAISNNIEQLFDGVTSESRYTGPALFIQGGRSDYIVDEDIPLIKKYFPSAHIKTISGASHWVQADAPEELCAILSGFLGRECIYSVD